MRFIVSTRRAKLGEAPSAKDAVSDEPGVKLLAADNPNVVTIEASEDAVKQLREKLRETHFVEPVVQRSLT